VRPFHYYDPPISPDCGLDGAGEYRVVLAEGSSVGGSVRGAHVVTFLAKDLVNLVAEALSTIRGAVGGRTIGGASLVTELVAHGAGVADVLRSADAAFGYVVRLAGDLRGVGDVRGGRSRAELEDWRLPVIALQCKLLVLGGLGRDTAWKVDIGED